MSFWPFNNSSLSNNTLLKFLDSIHDLSSVSVDDIVKDQTLVQELLNELHTVKGNVNKGGNFLFAQSNPDPTHAALSDSASLNSQNNDNNNTGSNKEARGIKLIELLIQPHILTGLIEILEKSVGFFHQQGLKAEENIKNALAEHTPATDLEEVDEIDNAKGEEDKDEAFRRSVQAAADILSFDISIISSRVIETPNLMNKLWLILKLENLQENCPTVSYLVHILDQLLEFNSIELLNFVRRQGDLVDIFLAFNLAIVLRAASSPINLADNNSAGSRDTLNS